MTRQTRSIDFTMLRHAGRIAAITLAGAALGTPLLSLAQSTNPSTPSATTPQQGSGSSMSAADAFKRADANQDGKLSKDELAAMPALSAKWAAMDKDQDGSVSLAEFSTGYTAK